MADLSQINSQLWTGAAITDDADVQRLADLGITGDIDLRLEFDDQSLIAAYNNLPPTPGSLRAHPQIAYLYNGVADDGMPKPASWFEASWTFAEAILRTGGVLLSHCAAGINRGPSTCYFLLCAYWQMAGDDAYALIKERRPIANVGYRSSADAALAARG